MTATLTPNNLLDYLREAKRGLTPERQRACDDFVVGVLSLHVPRQVWRDAVDIGVRLAKGETKQSLADLAQKKGHFAECPLFRIPTELFRTRAESASQA